MKVTIDIEPKEMADLANVLQDQLGKKFSDAVTTVLLNRISCETSESVNYEANDNNKNPAPIAEELEKDDNRISEKRFTEIIDGIYNIVHNPLVRNAKARKFPDMKISEYAAVFEL